MGSRTPHMDRNQNITHRAVHHITYVIIEPWKTPTGVENTMDVIIGCMTPQMNRNQDIKNGYKAGPHK